MLNNNINLSTDLETQLQDAFSIDKQTEAFENLQKEQHSVLLDEVFANTEQVLGTHINKDDFRDLGYIPLVRRGGEPVLTQRDGALGLFEPQEILIQDFVSASEIRNVLTLEGDLSIFLNKFMKKGQNYIKRTTMALAAQAIKGTIKYPTKFNNALLADSEITVELGSPLTVAAESWDSTLDYAKIMSHLDSMAQKLIENGNGDNILFLVGKKVMEKINHVIYTEKGFPIEFADEKLILGGMHKITAKAGYYGLPKDFHGGSGTLTPVVEDAEIIAIDLSAGHTKKFCAVDNLATVSHLPLLITPIKKPDGKGVIIQTEARPFVMPNFKGICVGKITLS